LLYVLYSLPLAAVIFVLLGLRRLWSRPLQVYVLQTDGELGHLIPYLELVRADVPIGRRNTVVVSLDFRRHEGLDELYRGRLGWTILWPGGFTGLLSQALLLQPNPLLSEIRLDTNHQRRIFRLNPPRGVITASHMARTPLEPTPKLIAARETLLQSVASREARYVLMAVHTQEWELSSNPNYASKTKPMETHGHELADGVDCLHQHGFDVLMVGSTDSGNSHVPREFPRLKDIGAFGGIDEIALASGCQFFWSDGVGAHWLTKPFSKPILSTNQWQLGCDREGAPSLCAIPLLYRRPDGHVFTLREMINDNGLFKRVTPRGDLVRIRNQPIEIVEGLLEMVTRLDGTFIEDEESAELRTRVASIYAEFPKLEPFSIPTSFLKRHSELLV